MVLSRNLRLGMLVLVLASMLASACSVIGKDKKSDDSGGSSSVKVTQGVFAATLDPNGAPINPTYAFPAGTKQINAVLLLEGVSADTKITARWYQLNVKDAPPAGAEVNSAVSTIKKEDIQDGKAVVRFSQASNNGLPVDSWQLRVYAGSKLIRTMGFVIVNTTQGAAQPPPAGSPPAAVTTPGSPPPAGATPTFTNYTVVAGDTVSSLATKFKPPAEDIAAFTTRFVQANNISATATLTPGQVLRVPR